MNNEKCSKPICNESKNDSKESLSLDRNLLRQRGALRVRSALRAGEPPADLGLVAMKG